MTIITEDNKKEIFYNLVNAFLAGILVLLGSFTTGEITHKSIFFALIASAIVMVTKLKEYWDTEKSEYSRHLFNFVRL